MRQQTHHTTFSQAFTDAPRRRRLNQTALHALRCLLALLVGVLAVGCGAKKHASSNAAIRVGPSATISRVTLAHWTEALAGDDYYTITGRKMPNGLVTDPPDPHRCATIATTLALQQAAPTQERISSCHELQSAIRAQAVIYLTTNLWRELEARRLGVHVTQTELDASLKQQQATQYPHAQGFKDNLDTRHWTVADETYSLRASLLATHLIAYWQQTLRNGTETVAQRIHRSEREWSEKTNCQAPYTAEPCSQYDPQHPPAAHSPSVILEQLTKPS
jgi:hypothetical protein